MSGDLCLSCLKKMAFSEKELRLYNAGKIKIEYGNTDICPECVKRKKLVSGYSYEQKDMQKLND